MYAKVAAGVVGVCVVALLIGSRVRLSVAERPESLPSNGAASEIVSLGTESERRVDPTPAPPVVAQAAFTVRVSDLSARPIRGAAIWVRDGSRAEPIGVTDDAGELRVPLGRADGVSIVASCRGYAPSRRYVEDVNHGDIELVLGYGRTISGWVEFPDGRRAENIRVVAVGAQSAEEILGGSTTFAGADPERLEAESGLHGFFEILNVPAEESFVLIAAGQGCLSRNGAERRDVLAGATDARVVVYPTYGAIVEFVDEYGQPASLGTTDYAGGGLRVNSNDEATILLSPGDWSARLAAISAFDLLLQPNEFVLLAQGSHFQPTLGPVTVRAHRVGFEPAVSDLELSPIIRGLGRKSISLVTVPVGLGAVDLRFVAPEGVPALDVEPGMRAQLVLTHPIYGHMSHGIDRITSKPQRVNGLPWGRYLARFDLGGGMVEYPPAGEPPFEFEVGAEVTEVEIPLGATGSIELSVRDEHGRQYAGELGVFIGAGAPVIDAIGSQRLSGLSAHFARAPYRLPLVQPGEYSLRLEYPQLQDRVHSITVANGTTARVDL